MDGFRWDYRALHPAETVHLRRYAAEGISASELIPVYPSNTFPNHYAIATGLRPTHSGIINNDMFDPKIGRYFRYNLAVDNGSPDWWGGEPIWVTAVKQGLKSASYYWVGAEAPIEGVRPSYLKRFPGITVYDATPFENRINEVVGWLKLPTEDRPSVITFYLEETNSNGHKYGPESPELAAAVKLLDGRLGELMDRLAAERLPVNLIVVSDHGMTDVSNQRVMVLEDYVDLKTVQVDFQGPEMGLRPLQGNAVDLVHKLAGLPHARAYLTDTAVAAGHLPGIVDPSDILPERFHLTGNPRIPEVWIVPELGWHMDTRAYSKLPTNETQKGDHGYDPQYRPMHGTLIAYGPSFKTGGSVIGPVENVQIYNLMCAVLHLKPAPNDGDDRLVRAFLR